MVEVMAEFSLGIGQSGLREGNSTSSRGYQNRILEAQGKQVNMASAWSVEKETRKDKKFGGRS